MPDVSADHLDRAGYHFCRSGPFGCAREKATPCGRKDALTRIHLTTEIGISTGARSSSGRSSRNFEMKANLRQLDTIRSEETIFATNTSSICVTCIAVLSKNPARVIGMHFFNPVSIMQLVEIIQALQTADAVCDKLISDLLAHRHEAPRHRWS